MILRAGINITEIADALKVASTWDGELCSHPNVKRWSRFKPLALPGISQHLRDTAETNFSYYFQNSNFWKGKSVIEPYANFGSDGYMFRIQTCGLLMYAYTSYKRLLEDWYFGSPIIYTEPYKWDKPTGDAQAPYRQGDFIGYDNGSDIGCSWWTDNVINPNAPDKEQRTYNENGNIPIKCTLRTIPNTRGSVITLVELLKSLESSAVTVSNIQMAAILFDEDKETEIAVADMVDDINNYYWTTSFVPTQAYFVNKWFGVAYFIKFRVSTVNNGNPIYLPITQTLEGGNNTKVTFINDGIQRYAAQRFIVTPEPPVTLQLVEMKCLLRNTGKWTDWRDVSKMQMTERYVTNNIRLHYVANTPSTGNGLKLTSQWLQFWFYYNGSSEPYKLIGTTAAQYNIRVSDTDTDRGYENNLGVDLPVNTKNKDVYVYLPSTFDGLGSGKEITALRAFWKVGGTGDPVLITSFNLSLTTA